MKIDMGAQVIGRSLVIILSLAKNLLQRCSFHYSIRKEISTDGLPLTSNIPHRG
jgi:hypothetical protein